MDVFSEYTHGVEYVLFVGRAETVAAATTTSRILEVLAINSYYRLIIGEAKPRTFCSRICGEAKSSSSSSSRRSNSSSSISL